MKILLINPSQFGVYGKMSSPDYPPLGLAYIGAALEKSGHVVKIIDIDADGITEEELIRIITHDGYSAVGLTATTPTFHRCEDVAKIVKAHSRIPTIFGGIHPTTAPEKCIVSPYVDIVVIGEGEITIIELIDALENEKDLSNVKGILFKRGDETIRTPTREYAEIDNIAFPARHLFTHKRYNYPDALRAPVMPVITSRGCPHSCTYCCTKLIFSRKMRYRSPENVVAEVEQLINDYGVKEVHFWDDVFTCNKKRVQAIRDIFIERKINVKIAFPNGLRADQVDEDILGWLKDMGAYSVTFGVESGNEMILKIIKKGTSIDIIKNAYRMAKKNGLETWGFFMLGLPGEDASTFRDTINLAKTINPDVAKFHILKPFPGTEAFFQLKEKNLITNFDYENYGVYTRPVHRLETISEDELMEWAKSAYREFYLRPSKIISHGFRMMKSKERFKTNFKTATYALKAMF